MYQAVVRPYRKVKAAVGPMEQRDVIKYNK